jgi:hypothetical protein
VGEGRSSPGFPFPQTQQVVAIGVSTIDVYINNAVRGNLKIGLISILTAIAGPVSLEATVPDGGVDSYQGIPERNVFGLRPPSSQPPSEPEVAPLPKITLTGITTILDSKRALMKVAAANPKKADPAKELSLILSEGQREGDIEVLQIDEKAGSVKVRNSGTVMVLTFERDGAKLPATPLPPGIPGAPPLPSALPGVQATNPYTLPTRNASTPPPFPGRNPRRGVPAPGVVTANGGVTYPVGGVPSPTGLPGTTGATPAPASGQDLTAEEQAIVMELQRQANPNNAALMPPTPLTPAPATPPPIESSVPATTVPPIPGRPTGLVPQ